MVRNRYGLLRKLETGTLAGVIAALMVAGVATGFAASSRAADPRWRFIPPA